MYLGEVAGVDEGLDILKLVNDEEEINGIMLGVVGDEVGHDLIN